MTSRDKQVLDEGVTPQSSSVGEKTVGEITVGEITVGELTVGEITGGEHSQTYWDHASYSLKSDVHVRYILHNFLFTPDYLRCKMCIKL